VSLVGQDFLLRHGGDRLAHGLAAWLAQKTSLQAAQIDQWLALDELDRALWAGANGPRPISPLNQRLLTWPELRRCMRSPDAKLERKVGVFFERELERGRLPAETRSSRFHAARLGAVYFLTNGRNAWHSTWINRYGPRSISGRLSTVRQWAEQRRVQGSVFYIERMPALVLQADDLTLVGVEVNPSQQMGTGAAVFGGEPLAGRVIEAYSGVRPNTVLWLHTPGNHRFETWNRSGEACWRSESSGPNYLLGWREVPTRRSASAEMIAALRMASASIRRSLA
jgi:hypothetical protein